jgi:hypothetical protein
MAALAKAQCVKDAVANPNQIGHGLTSVDGKNRRALFWVCRAISSILGECRCRRLLRAEYAKKPWRIDPVPQPKLTCRGKAKDDPRQSRSHSARRLAKKLLSSPESESPRLSAASYSVA